MEYYVAEDAFGGIFPTNDGQACIWVCNPAAEAEAVRRRTATVGDALAELLQRAAPELARRAGAARPASPVHGVSRLPNHVRQASGPGWALVGDAGYHRDPITGHGISDAFRDAELLATALHAVLDGTTDEAAALARYQAERDRMLAEVFDLTLALGAFPGAGRFVQLQKELGRAIDDQAAELATWTPPAPRSDLVVAA
jgi:2-polyprenyl-6-methoxyphenol hydroxylase-like FAD-dependent oxidoreductase